MSAVETQAQVGKPRRKRRIFLWVFLAIQVLFIIWLVTGAATQGHQHCQGLSAHDCAAASDLGNGLAVGLIIALWAAVDIILGISYGVYRLASRSSR
jgi:hypothetical protein